MATDDQSPPQQPTSDFLAAEQIRAVLLGRDPAEQERIIRWVSESLGLTLHVRPKSAHMHGTEDATPKTVEEEPAPSSPETAGKARDIRSFVQEKQPKSDVQFAVLVAYFHRFIAARRKEAITTDDLQEGARHSSRAVFKVPSVTLNNAVQQGYLDRGARGEYRLNAVGENLVAMTLPGANTEAGKRAGKARARSSGAKPKRKGRAQ